jgi:hypothetical protein
MTRSNNCKLSILDFLTDIEIMNKQAVSNTRVNASLALFAATAVLLVALVGTAGAASPVGKDGKIHACYRVKGKSKGSIRVVPAAKRCRRGERKVVWSAAGPGGQSGQGSTGGQTGATGQAGTTGQQGQAGAGGSSNEAVLKTEIASLALKLDALEGVLGGITHNDLLNLQGTLSGLTNGELLSSVNAVKGLTNGELLDSVGAVKGLSSGDLTGAVDAVQGLTNGDLSGAVDAIKGLTNAELTETVASLPLVGTLCEQGEGLTKQVNKVGSSLGEISLLGAGAIPGLGLKLPTIAPLGEFAC